MKTLKYFIVLCLIVLFEDINAQTKFFIKPTIDSKICTSTLLNNRYNQFINLPIKNGFPINPYFSANNVILSSRPCINFGVYVAMSINNGKHIFEIGVNEDVTGSAYESHYMLYSDNDSLNFYSNSYNRIRSSLFTYRYHMQYSLRLTKQSSWVTPYLTFGSGLIYNRDYNADEVDNPFLNPALDIESYGNVQIDENVAIYKVSHITYASNKYSGYINLGISGDFYTKSNAHLFSISIFYLQGFKILEDTYHRHFITDNGVDKIYSHSTSSRGSGLYFQLSRKFQFHPWPIKIKNS